MNLMEEEFIKRNQLIAILKVVIIIDEDYNTYVNFSKLHNSLVVPEFSKLIFHYYLKTLFLLKNDRLNTERRDLIADELIYAIDDISESFLDRNSNVLDIIGLSDMFKMSNLEIQGHVYEMNFFAKGGFVRHLITGIPNRGYLEYLYYTVVILIQSILGYLNKDEIINFQAGLRWLNKEYRNGVDFSKIENLQKHANMAYLNGMMSSRNK